MYSPCTPNKGKYFTKKYAKYWLMILLLMIVCSIISTVTIISLSKIISSGSTKSSPKSSVSTERGEAISCDFNERENLYTIDTKESIHLATICGGYSSTRSFYVLLKSILFYRTDPIHLHLFVDNISYQIFQELFSTWSVDNFQVSYYNITNYEKEVSWITNSHYSHRYGLMKLELFSILAEDKNLTKVIFLDTDTLVLGNIRHAWCEFKTFCSGLFKKCPIFGMVENQSDYYLREVNKWPSRGRGVNSGVILVDLELLRGKIDWREIWRQEAETQLAALHKTKLADQDIFNSVFEHRDWLIHDLPCSFNMQLNDNTKLEKRCPEVSTELQILHWNSPDKLGQTNPHAKLYRKWYINFRNWDAKLLESKRPKTLERDSSNSISFEFYRPIAEEAQEYCDNMRPKLSDKLRVYPYFIDFDFQAENWDVTYVVHLSIDRLQVLGELANNWKGPISAAIYLPEQETDLLISFIEASDSLSQRKNIGYHLVFRDYGFTYPINRMRNIALNHTVTSYVFLCDVDFLPSLNLYEYLKRSISFIDSEQDSSNMTKKALIVPAFESKEYKFDFPTGKQKLITQLNLGNISEFRKQIWPQGHRQTDFEKWKSSSSVYEVEWTTDFEPFIVTKKDVPRFDERFIGFGWNKVEHIIELAALKYKFFVLPEAFVIHKTHPPSLDIMKHRESKFYKKCIIDLKKTFLAELRVRNPRFFYDVYEPSKQGDEEEVYEYNWRNIDYRKG